MQLNFKAKVWLYPGDAAWHFISLPKKEAALVVKAQQGKERRGWGAVRVKVTIGKTEFETSIFPHKQSETYILPIKASVRKKEGVMNGDVISISVELR